MLAALLDEISESTQLVPNACDCARQRVTRFSPATVIEPREAPTHRASQVGRSYLAETVRSLAKPPSKRPTEPGALESPRSSMVPRYPERTGSDPSRTAFEFRKNMCIAPTSPTLTVLPPR